MISQRDAFFNTLYEIAKRDRDVYLVVADMAAPSLDKFRRDLSSQYINVGVAEQNAITIAAGLALEGKKVYVYSIIPFISLRCLAHIRIECAVMKLPITIVGNGAGFSYDTAGPTHHLFEDIAIMRAIPNITIHNVTDSVMAASVAMSSYESKLANYVRLDRFALPDIYNEKSDFSYGYNFLVPGENYILSTGIMTHTALEIADKFDNLGVIDVHTFPFDYNTLVAISHSKKLITMEENVLNGGLGSAICEFLNDTNIQIPVLRIGINNLDGYCHEYGGRKEVIWKYYDIDKETSMTKIRSFLNG